MALIQRTRLYELLARVSHVSGADRVVGMHARYIVEVLDDTMIPPSVVSATVQSPVPVDWNGLVALMHEDDRALLVAALEAE
jgi:hypothetical protein